MRKKETGVCRRRELLLDNQVQLLGALTGSVSPRLLPHGLLLVFNLLRRSTFK
jgi:hypothetical protein